MPYFLWGKNEYLEILAKLRPLFRSLADPWENHVDK